MAERFDDPGYTKFARVGLARRAKSGAPGLMLGVLLVIYTLSYIDRQIVVILQEPIRAEFHLHDWQLGLLTGASISLFYTALGIPIARWVDKGVPRVALIAALTALWSVMTALCGVSHTFGQFVVARMGVGMAEAGFSPTAHSLISDRYPLTSRPMAMGVFVLGVPFGIMFGLAGGGWIAQHYGWRNALLVVATPGLVMAALCWLFVREPVRGGSEPDPTVVKPLEFTAAFGQLIRSAAYVQVVLATGASSFALAGMAAWLPSFLIRAHGMTLTQAGVGLGLLSGVSGIVGTAAGGWQASRLGRRGLDAMLWLPIAGLVVALPMFMAALLFGGDHTILLLLLVPLTLGSLWSAPSIALTQSLAPVAARATAGAVYIVSANVIGVALGPITVGLASDVFTRMTGSAAEGLRWALVGAACSLVWGIAHWLFAVRALRRGTDTHGGARDAA